MKNIQVKLQTFAGAMTVPTILLMLVGFFVNIGSAFTNYILPGGSILYNLFTMITNLGFVSMNNLQLWSAVTVAFILAEKEKGWAAFAGLILFFCFIRGVEGWAVLEGWTAETTTVDALVKSGYTQQTALNSNALWSSSLGIYSYNIGISSGIVAGLIAAGLHNKFIGIKLPAMFGFFTGTKFVIIIVAPASIPLAIAFYYVWPYVADALQSITGLIRTSGLLETFVFGTLDRMLLSSGIHYPIAFPIEYAKVGGTMVVDGAMYRGVKNIISGRAASTNATGYTIRNFTNGRLLFQLAGLPGAAFAVYRYAKPEDKKKVASLLVPSAFTLAMVGISEPIEYTFLFVAPALYWLVYVPLCGLCHVAAEITDISVSGTALFFAIPNLFQSQEIYAMSALWLLPVTFIMYYFVFKFAIMKFNFKTPDHDDEGEVKLMSEKEYNKIKDSGEGETNVSSAPEGALEVRIIRAFGRADNIETVAYYASRLRVTVKDDSLITPDTSWKSYLETIGVVRGENSVQVIHGVRVVNITTKIKGYLHLD